MTITFDSVKLFKNVRTKWFEKIHNTKKTLFHNEQITIILIQPIGIPIIYQSNLN